MTRNTTTSTEPRSNTSPIYQVLSGLTNLGAVYTGKGTAPDNKYFSFHRPKEPETRDVKKHFVANLEHLARSEGFDPRRVALPNGEWPHSGQAIKTEDCTWITNPRTRTLMPVTHDNQPVTYDAIVTRSSDFVLAVQGADCPSIFFYDPSSEVIGLAHAGWKPLVRGVVRNTVDAMIELGANRWNITAFVAPGAGDRYNNFQWDESMEPYVREVFVKAGRHDLLEDRTIRHEMTHKDELQLRLALGSEVRGGTSFKLSTLAMTELKRCGLLADNISRSIGSCIVDCYPKEGDGALLFRYHSYRRERPNNGLSISVLFLKPEQKDQVA